jgi:hypothetical protein
VKGDDLLGPEEKDALAAERRRAPVAESSAARMLARLELAIGVGGLNGGGGAAPATNGDPGATDAPSGAAGAIAKIAKTAAVLGLGAALGGVGMHVAARSTPNVTVREGAPAPLAATTATASAGAAVLASDGAQREPVLDAPTVPVDALPTAPTAAPTVRIGGLPSSSASTLSSESALLDAARTALERGDPAAALESLRKHRARFPAGSLSEERDALTVVALARAGRRDEARGAAERFQKQHPGSVFGDAVRAAIDQNL